MARSTLERSPAPEGAMLGVAPDVSPHVILLVPGSPTRLEDLVPLAEALSDLGDVRILEPPGYGHTPEADGSMAARAAYLAAVRRSLDARRVSVVGYSAGAYDALAVAAEGEEFDRVVLLGGTVGPRDEDRAGSRLLAKTIAAGALSAAAMARILLAPQRATEPRLTARTGAWLTATSQQNLASEVASFAEVADLTAAAVQLGDRLRLIHAEHDAVIPLARAQALAERTGAPLTVLPGLGHGCMIESPQTVAEALRRTLAP